MKKKNTPKNIYIIQFIYNIYNYIYIIANKRLHLKQPSYNLTHII